MHWLAHVRRSDINAQIELRVERKTRGRKMMYCNCAGGKYSPEKRGTDFNMKRSSLLKPVRVVEQIYISCLSLMNDETMHDEMCQF